MEISFYSKTNMFTIKALLIAALVLLMLIPISMVKSIINEREKVKESVKTDISQKWGGPQNLTGPIWVLPYKESPTSKNFLYAYFLPEDFDIEGNIETVEQTVGLFKIPCYQSSIKCNGRFRLPDYEKLGLRNELIDWNNAYLIIGISSLQGIKNKIDFVWNGLPMDIVASNSGNPVISSGLTIKTPVNRDNFKDTYDFEFNLVLNGTDKLSFTPIGKNTHVRLTSDWNYVDFPGEFSPTKEDINDKGFEASWDIFDYNRNYPQMWVGESHDFKKTTINVSFQKPIDQYRKTMRSIKYAIMFIALTFLVFFIVELLSRKRIHPVQYLLVSFALVLFYCLLLALSEHIRFEIAYLISAIAIISLITAYSKSVFRNIRQTGIMGLFLTALYIFLYIILQLDEMSLLLGSIGLFIALAVVMYVSRRVDWYKKDKKENVNNEIENLPEDGENDET